MRIKIVNGTVIDGSGADRFQADVLVENDRIVKIGDCSAEAADKVIDAAGKIVAPGFIDSHTHSDFSVLYDGRAENRITAGVTTDICGNCGIGAAPVSDEFHDTLLAYLKTRIVGNINAELAVHWRSFDEYLTYMEGKEIAVNMVPLLAEGPVRIATMGLRQDVPTEEEMETMRNYVREGMEAGAYGMSSGLIYLPGAAVKTPELIEMCKVVAEYGGLYTTHMRDEGDNEEAAMLEAFEISKKSGARLHVSHLKRMGVHNAADPAWLFQMFDKAAAMGVDYSFDSYPYESGMSSLLAMLPPWTGKDGVDALVENLKNEEYRERAYNDMINGLPNWSGFYRLTGGFPGVIIATCELPENKWMEGMFIPEIAERMGLTPKEAFFKLLIDERCRTLIVPFITTTDCVDYISARPDGMICTDSATLASDGPLAKGKPHMRGYGTSGKMLSYYVREKKVLTLEQCVRKLGALAADRFGIVDRGYVREGYFADIVIFDKDTVKDQATIQEPRKFTSGIEYVFVNGQIAYEGGKQTAVRAGKVLRRKVGKKA